MITVENRSACVVGIMLRSFGVSIVYLTAHADEVTIERAKKTSPEGYLIKPVKARDLKETIEIAVRARKKPGVVCKPDDNGQH